MMCALLLASLALLVPLRCNAGCSTERPSEFSAEDRRIFSDAMSAMNKSGFLHAQTLLQALHSRHAESFEINEALGLAYASQSNAHVVSTDEAKQKMKRSRKEYSCYLVRANAMYWPPLGASLLPPPAAMTTYCLPSTM